MAGPFSLTSTPVRLAWLVVCFCWGSAAPVSAAPPRQDARRPTLTVIVVDPTGAVVPGAAVAVSGASPAVIQTVTVVSDGAGAAVFKQLSPGAYLVSVHLEGFQQDKPAVVQFDRVDRLISVRLSLAKLAAEVTVGAADRRAAGLDAPFSRTLTPLEIAQLPDDPVALEQALRQLAGPDATITVDGFRRGMLPPKSAIALITIKWADLSAETHSHSSVVVEIITKPGAEAIEGYGTLGLQPQALSANNPFDGTPSATNNSTSLMLSGPIWKGRTSFRAYGRAGLDRDPVPVTATVPDSVTSGDTVESVTRSAAVDWQITHQLGRTAFLRLGGSSELLDAQNLGVGGLDLPQRGYSSDRSDHALRFSVIAGRDARLFNHLRVSARRAEESWDPVLEAPAVVVSGAFNGGGAQRSGSERLGEWSIEDDFDLVRGAHAIRTGGAFEQQRQYSSEVVNAQGTYTFADHAAYAHGRPIQLEYRVGDPTFTWTGSRGGAYVQDNIRLGSSLALGIGVRWELQSGAARRWNPAPRVRASWTPLSHPGTKMLGGIGWYYDWIDASVFTRALVMDGVRQYDVVVLDPGYPTLSPDDAATTLPPSRYQLAPGVTLARVRRVAFGLEQQVGNTVVSLMAENSASKDGLRGLNLNAPGGDGTRPDPSSGNVTAVESTRRSSLKSFRFELRTKGPRVSLLTVRYYLRWAKNDADGAFSLPADNAQPEADWGPASNDVRHQLGVYALAPVTPRLLFTLFVLAASGAPYNVTTGRDDNGDTVINDRPPGVSRNSARGGAMVTADCRVTWRVLGQPAGQSGVESTAARGPQRSLSVVLAAQNMLNRTNPAGYSGVVGSPLFGTPLGAMPKRRIDLGITVAF